MPLLSFKRRFTPLIQSGFKCHTLRPRRERPYVKGEPLYLWQEQRCPTREFIGIAPCAGADDCVVTLGEYQGGMTLEFVVNGTKWSRMEAELFAIRDGFSNMAEMVDYWIGDGGKGELEQFPFDGQIVYWQGPIMSRAEFARKVEQN